jgi:hypothetical protein
LAGASVVAVLLALAPGQPVVFAASSTLYVDGGSSNCSDGGSGTPSQPYCTIGAAAKAATAGMSVVVNAGTYSEDVNVAHSGMLGAPITLAAATGASVTISGQPNGFTVSGQSWITISGFNITNTGSNGILLDTAAHITVDGNHVSSTHSMPRGTARRSRRPPPSMSPASQSLCRARRSRPAAASPAQRSRL